MVAPRMGRRRSMGLVAGLLALLAGCEPDYEGLSVQLISSPPDNLAVEVGYPWIRLPVGVALAVEIQPQSANQEAFSSDANLVLLSQRPDVARLFSTGKARRFVVVGHTPGITPVQIFLDETELGVMNIEVTGASR